MSANVRKGEEMNNKDYDNRVFVPFRGPEPTKGRPQDAAYDLRSAEDIFIGPGKRALVSTGLQVAIPDGMVGMVCPRSGLALNHGITVLNAPGIVDPGYTGDVGVVLYNTSNVAYAIFKGDRIAQLMVVQTQPITFATTSEALEASERGEQGFGSSGVA